MKRRLPSTEAADIGNKSHNRGVLFASPKKKRGDADFVGALNVGGKKYFVSATLATRAGVRFMTLTVGNDRRSGSQIENLKLHAGNSIKEADAPP
jgi:hypothetical protein